MNEKIKTSIAKILNFIAPVKDILWFLTLFILFDFLWKLAIDEGENHNMLLIFGRDFTESIYPICLWTAKAAYWTVHSLWGYDNFNIDGIVIYFDRSFRLIVVWGCTGVKQMVLFSFIIALYYGPWKQKLWFIPTAAILLNMINIIRIAATALIVKDGFPDWFIPFNEWYNNCTWDDSYETYRKFYMDWFQLFHYDVFKWLYYDGVMFLLWLLWQEKFNLPYQKKKALKTPVVSNKDTEY